MQDCTPDALSLMVWVSLHICDEEAPTTNANYSAHTNGLTGLGVIQAYPEPGVVEKWAPLAPSSWAKGQCLFVDVGGPQ